MVTIKAAREGAAGQEQDSRGDGDGPIVTSQRNFILVHDKPPAGATETTIRVNPIH